MAVVASGNKGGEERVAVYHSGPGAKDRLDARSACFAREMLAVVEELVVFAGVDEQRRKAARIAEMRRQQRIGPIVAASVMLREDRP